MLKALETINIQKLYDGGEKNFSQQVLRRVNLRNANLQNVNLEGADLSYADLSNANLTNANLTGCYLSEANLTSATLIGANLTGAYVLKAYLTKVNCQKAIFKEAYCTGSFLAKANLSQADLSNTFFNGSYLSGANFRRAFYNGGTRFDQGINPEKLGMIKVSSFNSTAGEKITIAEVVSNFEKIANITINYLGSAITYRNFENSRPEVDWLNNFVMNHQGKINYQGSLNSKATTLQLKWLEKWTNDFVKKSSLIIHDLPSIIEDKKLII